MWGEMLCFGTFFASLGAQTRILTHEACFFRVFIQFPNPFFACEKSDFGGYSSAATVEKASNLREIGCSPVENAVEIVENIHFVNIQ